MGADRHTDEVETLTVAHAGRRVRIGWGGRLALPHGLTCGPCSPYAPRSRRGDVANLVRPKEAAQTIWSRVVASTLKFRQCEFGGPGGGEDRSGFPPPLRRARAWSIFPMSEDEQGSRHIGSGAQYGRKSSRAESAERWSPRSAMRSRAADAIALPGGWRKPPREMSPGNTSPSGGRTSRRAAL